MSDLLVARPTQTAAEQLASAKEKIANLEVALATARRIGAAVGIIMANRKVTYDQAFEVIWQSSQSKHRKIRDLAEEVLEAGTIIDASDRVARI